MRSFLFAVNCANKTLPAIFFFFFLFNATGFLCVFSFRFVFFSFSFTLHHPLFYIRAHTRRCCSIINVFILSLFRVAKKKKTTRNEIIINMYTHIYTYIHQTLHKEIELFGGERSKKRFTKK